MEKKCTTVTCPECGHTFEACFIDYGSGKLDWFPECPMCKARFPVSR